MATVTLKDIGKSYVAVEVLKNIDLSIKDGEFVVLVGPSGCGKSTLLRMICGLEKITVGDIEIDGQRVNEMAPKDRDIAMVFQSYALYPNLTVAKNMAFSMEMRGEQRSDIEKKVLEAAKMLGLDGLMDRLPRHLSGGQRQRVAMGRAIVRDPKVFLFDEPLSNLDAKMRVQMRTEIRALQQKLGTTTIYVTHDQIEAMTMADTVVLMHDGEIAQSGPPLELFDRPRTKFVAGFIGSPAMNMLDGRFEHESGKFTLNSGQAVQIAAPGEGPESQKATLGIRPEHLELVEPDEGTLQTNVKVVEPMGSETLIAQRLGDSSLDLITRKRVNFAAGDTISLLVPPDMAHLFDASTGARIPLPYEVS